MHRHVPSRNPQLGTDGCDCTELRAQRHSDTTIAINTAASHSIPPPQEDYLAQKHRRYLNSLQQVAGRTLFTGQC